MMGYFHKLVSICFIIIAVGVNFTSAVCNGYAIELLKAENCAINGTAAYTVGTESTAFMTDDCDMVIRSCGDTLGYNTAMIKMSIQRNGIKFYRGRLDFCEMLEYHQSDQFISIKINGDQAMCPVQPGPFCVDYIFATGRYKGLIRVMVGKYEMKFEGTHDTGKSCAQSTVNIIYVKPTRAPQ